MNPTTGRSEPIRVLLVDHHEHVLWGLSKLVDGEWPRMMVIGASATMAEAAVQLGGRKPDVVVLDVEESGENCIDALPALLRAAEGAAVVVHTSTRNSGLRQRALSAGATAVVDKEAPADALLTEIERVHRARRS